MKTRWILILIALVSVTAAAEIMLPAGMVNFSYPIILRDVNGVPQTGLTITDLNVGYYVLMSAARDTNNATEGSLTVHADNTIKEIGLGDYLVHFPDGPFDNVAGTRVTLGVSSDSNAVGPESIVVLLVDPNYWAMMTTAGPADLTAIGTTVDTSLATYDGPTKTEMDNGFAALDDPNTTEIQAAAAAALNAYDPPTKTEMDNAFAALDDPNTAEIQAAAQAGATAALNAYDPPTYAELASAVADLVTRIRKGPWFGRKE